MRQSFSTIFRYGMTLVLGALCLLNGCSDEADYKQVDFSRTMPAGSDEAILSDKRKITVAIAAMVSPKETFSNYYKIMTYIAEKIDYELMLVQRKTYAEVNTLLQKGAVDLAFICTGPYVLKKESYGFEALVTPIVRGEPFYQAYLIVHVDSQAQTLEDLRGRVFAFSDPESHTGALIPTYWLSRLNETPETFFSRVHYTYSHDNSILAVARELVDGASVDGHIWEYYHARNPVNTDKTRIIRKSSKFGGPPFVISNLLPSELKAQIKTALVEMHKDKAGKKILDALMIDRFEAAQDDWYQTAREIRRQIRPE